MIATYSSEHKINNLLFDSTTSNKKFSKEGFSVVSLFSGCGGMDLGFCGGFSVFGKRYPRNPFYIKWANELNQAACRTYSRNIDDSILCGDVREFMHTLPAECDVLVGGFPCQDISINGKGLGINGKRSSLYTSMIDAIKISKPKVFVAENVKGLLLKTRKNSFDTIMRDFGALGYKVSYALYHAADYGVPQSRERIFIVGTAEGIKDFCPPKPERTKEKWITASEAIGDLEGISMDERINHIWSAANVSADQGNRRLDANRPGFHHPRRMSWKHSISLFFTT